jgi:hypothetical protein
VSRSGYTDDGDNLAMWRGQVANSIRGKRGQALLLDMVRALDAMPTKQLFQGHLVAQDGGVCGLGAVGLARGVDMAQFEKYIDNDGHVDDPVSLAQQLGHTLNAPYQLIQEIQYLNDEWIDRVYDLPNPLHGRPGQPEFLGRDATPKERWQRMRKWAVEQLKPIEDIL